jgi:hypothetical protein
MNDLKELNTNMFYGHLAVGVFALGLYIVNSTVNGVKIPIRTSYTDWNEDTEEAFQSLAVVYEVPLAMVASFVSFGGACLHFRNLSDWDSYTESLKAQSNSRKWYEFSISSSLMVMMIALVWGIFDVLGLIMIMSVNAGMCWFGDMFETINVGRKK